jgi:hypothetical protein
MLLLILPTAENILPTSSLNTDVNNLLDCWNNDSSSSA